MTCSETKVTKETGTTVVIVNVNIKNKGMKRVLNRNKT